MLLFLKKPLQRSVGKSGSNFRRRVNSSQGLPFCLLQLVPLISCEEALGSALDLLSPVSAIDVDII